MIMPHGRARRLSPLGALALAWALAACSGGGAPAQDTTQGQPGDTAELDAGPADAPGDAGQDLGPGDAGQDLGPEDGAAETGGDARADALDGGAAPCGPEVSCDDGNPCTLDGCVPATGACFHAPVTAGKLCNDGNPCTDDDACAPDGVCRGTPKQDCDDGEPCTEDVCDPDSGACVHTFVEGLACDDGDPCTSDDACRPDGDGGGSCAGVERSCDDGRDCSVDACDAATGQCSHDLSGCQCISDATCDDDNPCTVDGCDTKTGTCQNTPAPDDAAVTCTDGDPCTEGDACVQGVCVGTPKSCDDGLACSADWCDEATGACVHDESGCECLTDADCDDANPCTVDACADGNTCVHEPDLGAEGQACLTPTKNGACLAGACRGVVEVAVGALHACARLATGAIRCWGAKDHGALCVPPPADEQTGTGLSLLDEPDESASEVRGLGSPEPAELPALPTMAAGEAFTCAVVGGVVRCWGLNGLRQLGVAGAPTLDCAEDAGGALTAPPSVVDLASDGGPSDPVVSLAAGLSHVCALTSKGFVRCWGNNDHGQLGTGDTAVLPADGGPVASTVPLGNEAVAVAAGSHHSCALLVDGDVRCWGWNYYGQLGTGDTVDRRGGASDPPSVVHFEGQPAVAIAAGFGHTCAILSPGLVRCWGFNERGQLGAGHTLNLMDEPGEEPSWLGFPDDPPVELALGTQHTCVRDAAGGVRCWGANTHGQLGVPYSYDIYDSPNNPPPLVQLGGPAVRIYAGGHETCALLPDEQVRCWGRNDRGQLGIGSTTEVGGLVQGGPPPNPMPPEWITNAMGAAGAACGGSGAVCLSGDCTNQVCTP